VVALLGPRMRDAGLGTKLVIPDDLNPDAAYERAVAVLDDERARPFVGALAYHLYSQGGDLEEQLRRMAALGARHRLPVWMTEYSDERYASWPGALEWAKAMHQVIVAGDATAVDYLWGFFGSQERPHTLISLDLREGRYRGRSLTYAYHLTGQFSRFVSPGCVRVDASSQDQAVLTSAFGCPGNELVVVAVNTSEGTMPLAFSVQGGQVFGEVGTTRTGQHEAGVALAPVSSRAGGFDATLPGRTVTTFVARLHHE
jgi:glucosylceramidase